MEEKQLGKYNKRPDYGEVESAAKVAKDNIVLYYKPEDKILLAKFTCKIITRTVSKKTRKVTTKERTQIIETVYKKGEETNDKSFLQDTLKRLCEVDKKKDETLQIIKIEDIKACGLHETGLVLKNKI